MPFLVHAQTSITVDTSIFTASSSATSIQDFISKFYELGLGIAGIIAVGMIVVGAIYYTISGASPQKKGEAKDIIFSALWGLVLLFGSYLILKSVNPQLIELRDPGTGTGALLEIIDRDCSKITTLPECAEGQSATNPETGACDCRPKEGSQVICPEKFRPINFSPLPNYSWYNSGETIYNNNRGTVGNSSFVAKYGDIYCPKRVNIPEGLEFRTIDCDDCLEKEEWWSTASEGWGPYKNDKGIEVDTTGWVWAYYPRDTDLNRHLNDDQKKENADAVAQGKQKPWNLGSFAMCVMYAHYDPEDKEIERSDLDGLKPCVEFSTSTKSNWGAFSYGSGYTYTQGLPYSATSNLSIEDSAYISGLPIKSSCEPNQSSGGCACKYPTGQNPGSCKINTNLLSKLNQLKNLVSGWQITEAFPPTVAHSSKCHMPGWPISGTCVDISLTNQNSSCNDIQVLMDKIKQVGLHPINEYFNRTDCTSLNPPAKKYDTTTGGHIHVEYWR